MGPRKAVLVDLSPAATFIAYNYNTPVDVAACEAEAKRILAQVEAECGWMVETWHPHRVRARTDCDHPQRVKARINCTVWSEVFACPTLLPVASTERTSCRNLRSVLSSYQQERTVPEDGALSSPDISAWSRALHDANLQR